METIILKALKDLTQKASSGHTRKCPTSCQVGRQGLKGHLDVWLVYIYSYMFFCIPHTFYVKV